MNNKSRSLQVLIASGTAVSEPIDLRGISDMIIHMPAAWDVASIAFRASQAVGGTFLPVNDDSDALIEIDTPVADTAYKAPDINGARFIQIWSETAGADVNQTADRTLLIDLME